MYTDINKYRQNKERIGGKSNDSSLKDGRSKDEYREIEKDVNLLYFEGFLLFLIQTGLSDDEIVKCCELIDINGDNFEIEQIDFIENILGFDSTTEDAKDGVFPSAEYVKEKVAIFHNKRAYSM